MRQIIDFNSKWAFTKQHFDKIPTAIPKDWYFVNLPHTWNNIDGQDGANDYYRGRCLYAKAFDKSSLPKAEKYYLEIGAANSSADVYLGGKLLAHHDGGYSLFRVDITDALEDENLLIIAVDNSPSDRVYPQLADFTFYGGLYRGVNIIAVGKSHFDLEYFGTPGLMITPSIDGDRAHVNIKTWVTDKKPSQTVRYTVSDMSGNTVASLTCGDTDVTLDIERVILWHGIKNPYLYTASLELIEDGEVIDSISSLFGCRSFKIDAERGFILNGEEYPLRGVSRHQDRLGLGNALLAEHHREDIELITELGATTVRLAHYQHDSYFYDLCDARGIIVWAEIPYISQHMPAGRENTVSQMSELITQNYNHPSIICWGLSNEITMRGDTDPDLLENHRILNDLCHSMDKTRPTAVAAVSPCPIDSPYLKIPDLVSYNHYFGWYGGDTSMNGPWFDNFHEKNPDIPIGCSEYGCEGLDWHTSEPHQGDYTEEYQAYYHEELIKQLFSRKYLWSTYVWNMFDFGADARSEGGECGQNHKGLVTMNRKYKKDAFYAYKAWLSDEKFVHICGKRYIDRVEDVTRVTVYSNMPEVELFANGVSIAKKSAPDHFFRFDVKNEGKSELIAAAGDHTDTALICKVDTFNEKYRLKEAGAVLRWYDISAPEGCFSLLDKIEDITSVKEGAELLDEMLFSLIPKSLDKVAGGFEMNEGMLKMLGGFTVLRLSGMMSTFGAELTKERLLEINAALGKIKKPTIRS